MSKTRSKSRNSSSNRSKVKKGPLPVTLLSGFLGAGKTTLLQHILSNKQNLKCAVIVNDMATINIDATLIEKGGILQKEEKLVKFQNGCICCTLRGDLLTEVGRLAATREFDYLVIESTGISEPMQVAETFAMDADELAQLGSPASDEVPDSSSTSGALALKSLVGVARLDTCVTVVDATQLFDLLDTALFLGQHFQEGGIDREDDRTVSSLLVQQIEFADVVLVNKIDLVSAKDAKRCEGLIRSLNKSAEIIATTRSQVDLTRILDTGKFNMIKAMAAPGWLQSLQEVHTPETLEYGISSFVYKRRLPFHPQRLFDLLQQNFLLMEEPELGDEDDHDHDENDEGNQKEKEESDWEDEDTMTPDAEEEEADEYAIDQNIAQQRLANKRRSCFKNVFRSKGFLWIATRPKNMGELSQAGLILEVSNGGNWFCELPKEMWPDDGDVIADIKKDFRGKLGDKRQEIVFIGQFDEDDKAGITAALDSCLISLKEANLLKQKKYSKFEDPWEEWKFYQ